MREIEFVFQVPVVVKVRIDDDNPENSHVARATVIDEAPVVDAKANDSETTDEQLTEAVAFATMPGVEWPAWRFGF